MKQNLYLTTFWAGLVLALVLILFWGHTLLAQPQVPPGLLQAPPCLEAGLLPGQARVPCAALLEFSPGTAPAEREAKVHAAGAELRFNYQFQNAAAVRIPNEATLQNILADSQVVALIPDRAVSANPKPDNPGKGGNKGGDNSGAQTVPSGVERIGAAPGLLSVTGDGVGVAIVDTGLDFSHGDLNVAGNCFSAYGDCDDQDGHGTHVGGIVAAMDNEQDAVGVAPEATLYGVRVLDGSGNGSDATVMAGLEWVAQNADLVSPPIMVVNMSLGREGSLADNPLLREAIRVLVEDLGISVVTSAGNDQSLEVYQNVPATYPEVMAVASTTSEDGNNQCRFLSGPILGDTASFFTTDGLLDSDNIGVTISAPGARRENVKRSCSIQSEGILSLKLGGGTTRMSGTSMASPHVAGVVALLMEQSGGSLDPESIRQILRNSASLVGIAPLDSPVTSYSFDGEREGVLSACGALGENCP